MVSVANHKYITRKCACYGSRRQKTETLIINEYGLPMDNWILRNDCRIVTIERIRFFGQKITTDKSSLSIFSNIQYYNLCLLFGAVNTRQTKRNDDLSVVVSRFFPNPRNGIARMNNGV